MEDPNTALNGPSSACQQNAIEMAFGWRADNGPTLNTGLVSLWLFRGSRPVLQRKPVFLWFFRGRGGVWSPMSPLPSGSAHVLCSGFWTFWTSNHQQFEECFSIFVFLLIQLPVGKEKVERAEAMLRNPRCLKTLVYNPNPHSSMAMVHRKEIMDMGCLVIQLTRFLIQCSPFIAILC